MLAAEELNMIDSGEYVFFNIEIFGRYVLLRVSSPGGPENPGVNRHFTSGFRGF
jgi:hypothetical protein